MIMISNYQECQNLIKKINSDIDKDKGFMQNPEEQYQQRNNYIEVLEYALNSNELYHLYDIWQVFARARDEATRGFFLDLWDIYEKQDNAGKYQRERNILRHFVGQINNQFDEILLAKTITAPRLWQDYIQEILNDLIWIENEDERELQRKLLYSMSHLYTYLYPQASISAKEEKSSLVNHLKVAEEAKVCVAQDDFLIDLKKVFGTGQNDDDGLQRQFTLAFLYLYRFINHFGVISLENFVTEAIDYLQEEEFIGKLKEGNAEELLNRLLRYWAANSPLIRIFLQEKLGFIFYEYDDKKVVDLPSPYGTDNFIYTIGASGVGKTYLFHAMEECTQNHKQQLPLSIEYIDASTKTRQQIRDRWEETEDLEIRDNHLIRMRSKVRNLCRFTFYEIEDILIKDSVTKWQSLEGYFERHLPAAIILVFSTEDKDNLDSYRYLVNLLDRLAEEEEKYRNIPIYFVFNQSDKLLANIETNQQLFEEFQCYLNSSMKISEGFNFFCLRYQQKLNNKHGALEIANSTKACCSNLAFLNQLNCDIKRVNKIVNDLLDYNFTNLSFIHTSSLFKPDSQYTDLQTLWRDITDFIIQATCKDVEKYYRQEFQKRLERDFFKLDLYYSSAEVDSSHSSNEKIFKELNESPNVKKMEEVFDNFMEVVKNKNKINVSDILSLSFDLESTINNFVKEKEFISSNLDKSLRANLKELGIPIETSQIERNQNNQDFYLRDIEFIEPEDINYYDYIWRFYVKSPAIKEFTTNSEYQQIVEEIQDLFYEKISDFNRYRSGKNNLNIYPGNLEILTEQFPLQLQAIDIANRNQAFEASIKEKFLFSDVLNNTSALCLIQCGQFEDSDRNFIQGTERGQTVFQRFCEFYDLRKARNYCQLLSNYLPKYHVKPKYPQFILVKRHRSNKIQVELDEIKINVIKNLDNKLKEQQELLIGMIEILLKNRQYFHTIYRKKFSEYEYKKYISNLYLAKYLLNILELHGFDIEHFQAEPNDIMKQIANAINNLIDSTSIYSSQQGSDDINLDSFRNDYQKITVTDKWYSLNTRDINSKSKEIETELKTAFNIYQQILNLVDEDSELLKEISGDIVKQFILSETNEYNHLLEDYVKQRKLLIILERVEYLRVSNWIEDLEWLNNSFREYYDIWVRFSSLDKEELNKWKQRFIQNIDKLLKTELFSHQTE